MNRISVCAAASVFTLFSAGIVQAQDSMSVRVGDLNLNNSAGAQVALRRIDNAATRFCGPAMPMSLSDRAQRDSCHKQMTAKAVRTLGAPRVTALYQPETTVRLAQNDRR
ncbi:hypothetical protein DJ021_13855 [Phenylobacterium hankyongense]|uniref:UrcA family protein n=1 Tax=Phenylobacterium hankyongense TaxID=1813876 RepID=A0A328B2S6_9CAUL|nr:UrcA family protein [Phenylobacterium hankyongense]RAK60815.1 hypothetical protein DJ021_13855 [Phenylobacterium hankyongense]